VPAFVLLRRVSGARSLSHPSKIARRGERWPKRDARRKLLAVASFYPIELPLIPFLY
jgi:hypothetical protein